MEYRAIIKSDSTSELYHHGIKGMRWGVRRYQNKDGTLTDAGRKRAKEHANKYSSEDFTLKKGTSFQRIGNKNETDNDSRTYVSFGKADNAKYIDVSETFPGGYKIELKSVNSLQIAKGKTLVDTYIELYGDTPTKELIGADRTYRDIHGKERSRYSKDEIKERTKAYKNAMKDQESFDESFKLFTSDLMGKTKISSDYFERLKNKGYNAMYDYNDREFADNPLIVFNRSKDLRTTKISEITNEDLNKAYEYILNQQKKKEENK